jgi:methylated-DNA-[protein]-cysteine S-methyltransferase
VGRLLGRRGRISRCVVDCRNLVAAVNDLTHRIPALPDGVGNDLVMPVAVPVIVAGAEDACKNASVGQGRADGFPDVGLNFSIRHIREIAAGSPEVANRGSQGRGLRPGSRLPDPARLCNRKQTGVLREQMETQRAGTTSGHVTLSLDRLPSPIGTLLIVCDETHLRALEFADHERRLGPMLSRRLDHVALRERRGPLGVRERLERYFEGELTAIDDIPVATNGTPFESAVWGALRKIPVGTVTTYGALAVALEHPLSASRAVGLANGSNPIPIVLPCHRVIGANGNLTGYGGGMHRKRWLLHHEGVLLLGS